MPISQPNVTLNLLPAVTEVSASEQRVLFVGQKVPAGTAASGELVTDIENNANEDALFGENSQIASMIRAAKRLNKETRFDAIALDDAGAAVDATGTIAFVGTSTASGVLDVYVGSEKNSKYSIAVAIGDTATVIGAALVVAIAADTKSLVSSVNVTGTVTMTAVNGGLEGNNIGLKVLGTVAGLTHSVTAMSSGATNPTLTSLFDAVGDLRYQTIVWPSTYDLSELTGFLDARFNVNDDVLDGVGIVSFADTFSNLKVSGDAENSESLVILGNRVVSSTSNKGGAIFELNAVIAAQFAALRSLRLTPEANIADITIASTQGARDSFGGPAIASLPYFNTPFNDLPLVEVGEEWTREETAGLNASGISVLGNNQARNQLISGEIVTTYKTNSAGIPDPTWKFLNLVDTGSNIREYMVNNLKARFAQSRLTIGDVQPLRSMANQQIIEAYVDGLYVRLSTNDFVLTAAGEAALQAFKANRVVTIDLTQGKVSITMKAIPVVQLRTINGSIQIDFSENS